MNAKPPEGQSIVAFYEGSAPDDRGRFLEDVLRFTDAQLEHVHDFIQWLFPLRERSGANPDAPCLDDYAVAEFQRRAELRDTMRRALDRMLAFYGFRREGDWIVPSPAFREHARWLTPGNHNHLRLTRMLKSLRLLGRDADAKALYDCLSSIYENDRRSGRDRISERTFRFWREAAS